MSRELWDRQEHRKMEKKMNAFKSLTTATLRLCQEKNPYPASIGALLADYCEHGTEEEESVQIHPRLRLDLVNRLPFTQDPCQSDTMDACMHA